MRQAVCTIFIFLSIFGFSVIKAEAKTTPAPKKIKILIVPGHDDETWGSQYGNIKEADMNLQVATRIYNALKKDKRFQVYITRDSLGYTTTFADYINKHQADIIAFKVKAKADMKDKISSGDFTVEEGVPHVSVKSNMSLVLYGINKWADENKMDAVIHVHFNDYPRPNKWTKGEYKGFAIYTPEEQMVDSKESTKMAKSIFKELKKKYSTSTYEKELGGLIPDQSLIALGSNGTLNASVRSVLIEYGYIYRFANSTMRHKAYPIMANQTVVGIKNYFFAKK